MAEQVKKRPWLDRVSDQISEKAGRSISASDVKDILSKEGPQITSLTLEWSVTRATTPNAPGELRVRCGAAGIVLVMVRLKQAPEFGVLHEVPEADWHEGIEQKLAAQSLGGIVRTLLGIGQQQAEPAAPKLVIPT